MATITLIAPPAHDRTAFDVAVVLDGCPVGATVTCTISQAQGAQPFIPPLPKSKTAFGSKVVFGYKVQLAGPATCGLVASAFDDRNTTYETVSQEVQIV